MSSEISLDNYNSFSGADVTVTAQMAPINDGDRMKFHILSSLQTISYSTHQDKAPVRAIGNINALDYVMGQRTIAGTMVFAMFDEHWMTPLLKELNEYTNGSTIWSDELPALNLTISMANEYGYKSSMVLYGVKFIDDGGVMSINDLYTENTLQFLAVGIEPLKSGGQYKHHYDSTKRPDVKIVSADHSFLWKGSDLPSYRKIWTPQPYTPNPGKTPVDVDTSSKSEIEIINPLTPTGSAIINVYTPEEESKANLYIKNIYTQHTKPMNETPLLNKYYTTVEEGDYVVVFENPETNEKKESSIITVKKNNTVTEDICYPVICDVTNNSVKLISNNKNHDAISLKEFETIISDDDEIINKYENPTTIFISDAINSNKEIEINNLKQDTNYALCTFNSQTNKSSETITFRTFKVDNEIYDIFKTYVQSNKNLHVNDFSNFDFESLKTSDTNIIDSVLKVENNDKKAELLFYAEKMQNEIMKASNDTGLRVHIYNSKTSPLEAKFDMEDDIKSFNIYMKSKNKNFYVTSSNPNNDYIFTGKSDIRYFIQPILNNNKKGCYNDFICYSEEEKELLSKYNNVNNLSNATFLNYKNNYELYNSRLKDAIKAADNLQPYKELFEAPFATMQNDILKVDVNYKESIELKNDTYYLCIALAEDCLDYTPIRKIPFACDSEMLTINKYYSGILKNNYYLLWIEETSGYKISKPFIISSYEEDNDYKNYNNSIIKDYMKYVKGVFTTANVSFLELFNTVYLDLVSKNDIGLKDIQYIVAKNIIENNDGASLLAVNEALYNVFALHCSNTVETMNKFTFKDKFINFEQNLTHHMSSVTITKDSFVKKAYPNFSYDINSHSEGYTLLFLTNSYSFTRTGFILINNLTKEIFSYNLNMEVI